jgi:hypothetical protein
VLVASFVVAIEVCAEDEQASQLQYAIATKTYHLHVQQRQRDEQPGVDSIGIGHFGDAPYAALYEGAFLCQASMTLYMGMFGEQDGEAWALEMRIMNRERMLRQSLYHLNAGMVHPHAVNPADDVTLKRCIDSATLSDQCFYAAGINELLLCAQASKRLECHICRSIC